MSSATNVLTLGLDARQRIVVADEDSENAVALCSDLTRLGHDAVHVDSGGALIGALREEPATGIVLSASLPDIGAEAMCRRLRSVLASVRLIVLLPTSDEIDVVLCLEAGADDCISRPYRSREIMARLNAIGRRQQHVPAAGTSAAHGPVAGAQPAMYGMPESARTEAEYDGVRIDLPRREVLVGDVSVDLTRKEFDLLALLIEHRSFVVSRELIAERVWNGTWSRRTIDTHVSSLRSKLDRPALIQTVRGVGFKLSA